MPEYGVVLFFILVCMGGGFIQRVSGFGFGIFSMLFLPFLLGSSLEAATVSGAVSCVGAVYNAWTYRKHLEKKKILPILLGALLTTTAAVLISGSLSNTVMKKMLGAALIVLSLYFLFFSHRIHLKESGKTAFAVGALGGILNGFFSTGGPPVVLYLVNVVPENLAYLATIQAYFSVTGSYTFLFRAVNGYVTFRAIFLILLGLFGLLAGNAVGKKVFEKLDGNALKKVIFIGMSISGFLMLF